MKKFFPAIKLPRVLQLGPASCLPQHTLTVIHSISTNTEYSHQNNLGKNHYGAEE